LDRLVLIEFLALALLINAAAILLVLRARRSPHAVDERPSGAAAAASPATGSPADDVGAAALPPVAVPSTPELPDGDIRPPPVRGQWSAAAITDWSDRIRTETARCQRYGRPAAIVAMRLDGLEAIVSEAGSAVGAWLCRVSARTVQELARDSDLVQSDGLGSFRALLVETDETGARTYVERSSRLLVPWPDDPRAAVRLIAGWAGTCGQPDLGAADRLAQARLEGASGGWIQSVAVWRRS